MRVFDRIPTGDLERRELQLTVFACLSIGILAIGTAVLMYPVVFSHTGTLADKTLRNAFFGFCCLCLLLAGYLWDRQSTIRRLRSEMAEGRRRHVAAQVQACQELLKTMPKFSSFQDRLPMEYRRSVATGQRLSITVVNVKAPAQGAADGANASLLADAAKAISRRLREQDSLYMLGATCFGAVLPGMDVNEVRGFSARVAEGLADAAGASSRFSYKIDVLNYPGDAASAHELLDGVRELMPADNSVRALAEEALV